MRLDKLRHYILLMISVLSCHCIYADIDVAKDYVVSPEGFSKSKPEFGNYEIWTPTSSDKKYFFYPASSSEKYFRQIANVVAAAIHKLVFHNDDDSPKLVPTIRFVIADEEITDAEEADVKYNMTSFLGSLVEAPGEEFQIFSQPISTKIDRSEVERFYAISNFLGLSSFPDIDIFGFVGSRLKRTDYADAFRGTWEDEEILNSCFRNSFFIIDKEITCRPDHIAQYKSEFTSDSNTEKIKAIIRSFKVYLLKTLNYTEHSSIKSVFKRISHSLSL